MRAKRVVVILFTIFARSSSTPDAIDDFNRISSSLSQMSRSEMKITEIKELKKIQLDSKVSDQPEFLARFLHQGHNLFFRPQILIGPGISVPFLSHKVEDEKEHKENVEIHINKNEPKENEACDTEKPDAIPLPDIPEAPMLAPLIMPELPKAVVVKEPVITKPQIQLVPVQEMVIRQDTVVIPKLPAFLPLHPPRIPVEVVLPKPLPHIPTCLIDNVRYGLTVPCPPTIAVSPALVGIEKVVVKESLLVPKLSPTITLRLPKIPLGVVYNKPVETLMPYPGGFIGTTRFLPSVKVSNIPLERFSQKLVIPSRSVSALILQNIRNQKVKVIQEEGGFSSFSAYCAHNIALERVLPNIFVGEETLRVEPLPRTLEIPVRPVF